MSRILSYLSQTAYPLEPVVALICWSTELVLRFTIENFTMYHKTLSSQKSLLFFLYAHYDYEIISTHGRFCWWLGQRRGLRCEILVIWDLPAWEIISLLVRHCHNGDKWRNANLRFRICLQAKGNLESVTVSWNGKFS